MALSGLYWPRILCISAALWGCALFPAERCHFPIQDYWQDVFHLPYWDFLVKAQPELEPLRDSVQNLYKVWYPITRHGAFGFESTETIGDYSLRLFIPTSRSMFAKMILGIEAGPFPGKPDKDGFSYEANAPFEYVANVMQDMRLAMRSYVPEPIRHILRMHREDVEERAYLRSEIFAPVDYNHLFSFVILTNRIVRGQTPSRSQ